MTELTRVYKQVGDGWQWVTEVESGGGGGSQDLAQVLAVGGDPDGNPVTGPLQIATTPADTGVAFRIDATAGAGIARMVNPSNNGVIIYEDAHVFIEAESDDDPALAVGQDGAGPAFDAAYGGFVVGPTGAVTISPSDPAAVPLTVIGPDGAGASLLSVLDFTQSFGVSVLASGKLIANVGLDDDALSVTVGAGYEEVLTVGPTGAVTISPSDPDVAGVTVTTGGIVFPSSDPGVVGAWWDNAGTLTRSAG